MITSTITLLLIFFLAITTKKVQAQEDYQIYSEIFVINEDVEYEDEAAEAAALRMLNYDNNGTYMQASIFNFAQDGSLSFGINTVNSSENDEIIGEVAMRLFSDGQLYFPQSLVIDNLGEGEYDGAKNAEGARMTVFGNFYITEDTNNFPSSSSDTSELEYELWVENGIVSSDFSLKYIYEWSDHVFTKDYVLPKLKSVENYIAENKHLPNVPSEKEIVEQGYDLHQMNVILLQKIEELTLYTIQHRELLNNAIKTYKKP